MKNKIAQYSGALLIGGLSIFSHLCSAQTPACPTILEIVVAPAVDLRPAQATGVVRVPQRRASSPILSINGQPAAGSFIDSLSLQPHSSSSMVMPTTGGWTSGMPAFETWAFDLRQTDGTPMGTIMASAVPGAQEFPIVSAIGVYEGVQGTVSREYGALASGDASRPSPVSDIRYTTPWYLLTLYPVNTPEIANIPEGPALVHAADAAPVSARQPIRAGEALTMYASDLLPQAPDASGASRALPVSVSIGGQTASVLWAGRYQDSRNGFQINVRVPEGLTPGIVDVRLAVGFIAAPVVQAPLDGN